ncbi:hypothetical protein J2Z82_000654 [Virgibacillus litoralis]|uniref:Uncharacterized protein n=1 Tax=Virgibacillus litoralis TaxID=578221 RepID=A0ABS4HA35_9BACI|nr:hypothetical protein [Virgibacillus litoralis]
MTQFIDLLAAMKVSHIMLVSSSYPDWSISGISG